MITKARPNPKKLNPSLAHLRRLVVWELTPPEPEPGRYEKELAKFTREWYPVQLEAGTTYFNEDGRQYDKGDLRDE